MDRETLSMVAPAISLAGSIAGLVSVARSPKDPTKRAALISAVFGTIGSAAWAAVAYQEMLDRRADAESVVTV